MNQDRCEDDLSVVVASIVAANCASMHGLLKQELNYALLSFEEKFTRINDDSDIFFCSYAVNFCRLFSAITSCFVQQY